MWMDESHHWLVARESHSLSDLIINYQYDGHPSLWLMIMYLGSSITDNPMCIQYIHGSITLLAVALLLFKSPLPRIFVIAFIFSYFPLYEYGVLARNYGLLMLFAFCLPVAYQQQYNWRWLPWLILGLIANTHLFGLIFTLAYLCIYLGKTLWDHTESKPISRLGLLIYSLLCGLSLYFIIPPGDHPSSAISFFSFDFDRLADALMIFFKALVPIPDFTSDFFWNTNLLTTHLKFLIAPFALLSWLFPFIFKWEKKWLLSVWYLTAFLICSFQYFTTLNSGVRYGGILIITLIVLKWIDSLHHTSTFSAHPRLRRLISKVFIAILILVQSVSAIYHLYQDIRLPFSNTKSVHTYIKDNSLDAIPVVSNAYCNCISYNNYTPRPIYFLNVAESMHFCHWKLLDKVRSPNQQYDLSISITKSKEYLSKMQIQKVILLYNGDDIFQPQLEQPLPAGVELLKTFNDGIVKRENFAVYLIE